MVAHAKFEFGPVCVNWVFVETLLYIKQKNAALLTEMHFVLYISNKININYNS